MKEKLVKLGIVALAAILIVTLGVITPVEAVSPSYPARWYIQDITMLGHQNILIISSLGKQTGQSWPYGWRSRESVAREIQVHCWRFDTTTRYTTISLTVGKVNPNTTNTKPWNFIALIFLIAYVVNE